MISGGAAPEQRAGHDLAPVEHVALDQRGDDADRQHQLVRRGGEGERIEELRPGHREGEDGRRDQARQRHRDEHPEQDLPVVRAVHQRRLVELLRDRGEVADHDPGAERHRQRRIEDQQHPPSVDELDVGPFVEHREHLEQRDEQQRLGNEVGQEDAGRERRRAPELHARQRERRRHRDQHGDGDDDDRHERRVAEEREVLRGAEQLDVVAERRVIDPPRIGRGRNLRAGLERRDEHVDRRREEEDREHHQEEIRPAQRPAAVAAHAAIGRPGRAARSEAAGTAVMPRSRAG